MCVFMYSRTIALVELMFLLIKPNLNKVYFTLFLHFTLLSDVTCASQIADKRVVYSASVWWNPLIMDRQSRKSFQVRTPSCVGII